MMCTFCGSENRPENRFCDMCGVRMERRQQDRRTNRTENLRCGACNHVNEPGHKFCGMCGGRIERRVKERRGSGMPVHALAGESVGRAAALANAQLPSPEMPSSSASWARSRATAPAPAVLNQMEREEPPTVARSRDYSDSTIGGPSFLGLSSDPHADGEYLLEDETSSRSGLRKLVLLVVLLAIAGLIFVQWRASYHASPRPLEPPKPGPATVPRPEGKNQTKPVNSQETESAKNNDPAGTNPKADRSAASGSDGGTAEAATRDLKTTDSRKQTATAAEQPEDAAIPTEKQPKQVALKGTLGHEKSGGDSGDVTTERVRNSSGAPKPNPALTRAQRYLQGRGVRQSCAQGMMYLKAATEQNDPNADVQMAALYASGHCVQQDRVKAYQWFASAYSQEPNNQWIAKNMNQLWGQMTPQQRRQFQ